jgi:hypothetical protein
MTDTATAALNYVVQRAVPPQIAFGAGFTVVEDAQLIAENFHPRPALVLPYHDENGQPLDFCRVRYFDPPLAGGVKKKAIRYQQPKGTPPEIYLPKIEGLHWSSVMADPSIPIAITEGEVKSLSASVNSGVPFIGLGGVYMWADNKLPIKMFERFNFERRDVYIVFDSDIDTNPHVQLAEARLASYLMRRRAKVKRARLPAGMDGDKQGCDDFIAAHGAEAFKAALLSTDGLSDMDIRIIEMNEKVCYLEQEEKVMPLDGEMPLSKASFTEGSIYSTLKAPVYNAKGEPSMKSVAKTWLQHPMARRYANTIFRPGAAELVKTPEGLFLNSWREQPCKQGDVTHFRDLTKYLFEETLGDDWDWPIKLLAWKAQNQTRKAPLAIMLIGEQGSGKSLWARMVQEAFGQYGTVKSGRDLDQSWNGFIEKSLVAIIDDVSARQMRANVETLRNWISESKVERIEKYLKNRIVDNYCQFIFTSNHRDAGAFAHDDRRFLVVGAPRRSKDADYYDPLWQWTLDQGGAYIYNYLLNYDLQGWTPPIKAPDTAEKKMAHEESLSEFAMLARQMRESDHHIIEQWLQTAEQWAMSVIGSPGHPETPRANELMLAIQHFPIRPWYTADELCHMFPHFIADLHNRTKRFSVATIPGKVSSALRNEGIYFLKNKDDDSGFLWKGQRKQYLIVCPRADYPPEMSQAEFDAHMNTFGNYKPIYRGAA